MPNLEIIRCTLTMETTPLIHQYGWAVHGLTTFYSLPFRSPEERERFVRLLDDHVGAPVPTEEVDSLAALLCLSRSTDEAAYHCAATHLEREYASRLQAWPLGKLDDLVERLLEGVCNGRPEARP